MKVNIRKILTYAQTIVFLGYFLLASIHVMLGELPIDIYGIIAILFTIWLKIARD